jgi:hypothetical protein
LTFSLSREAAVNVATGESPWTPANEIVQEAAKRRPKGLANEYSPKNIGCGRHFVAENRVLKNA